MRTLACVLLLLLGGGSFCQGCPRVGRLGRVGLKSVPQDPHSYKQWKNLQHQHSTRHLQQAAAPAAAPAAATPAPPAGSAPAANSTAAAPPVQQQPQPQGAQPNAAQPSNSTGATSTKGPAVPVCPAWAPAAATSIETLPPLPEFNTATDLDVVTDLNAVPDGGLTVRGRQEALAAAVIAAVAKATNNATQIEGGLNVATPPGIFEPLNEEEILAVYAFLLSQTELDLTAIEEAETQDNYVAWLELAPPNKAQVLEALDGNGDTPNRKALAMLIQGKANPPRVTQVRVGPLPEPTTWEYVALSPDGTMEAGWLQRPYTGPESSKTDEMMIPYFRPLTPLMKAAFDGWYLGPKGEDNETKIEPCGEKCLTFSVGAPFGSAPAQPAGTRVDPDNKTGGQEGKDVRFSQRRLWVFFYRNMEGHHLHTVGLEVAFDVEDFDPANWKPGPVWFADTLWPSIDNLTASWTATMSNSSSVAPELADRLRKFKAITPSREDAIYSTFAPRAPEDAAGSGATRNASAGPTSLPPGPPVVYEPTGRRFKLGPYSLDAWMGWSLSIGHKPTTGISFWNMNFKGNRIVYELSLQEAYAGYGGPSPMQSHVQYFDSHWGLGTAYKELVAGMDCPTNAAFMDLIFSFSAGPVRMRNALCVFELPLGKPLLRHWADASGDPLYYGAVAASTLVIRGISAVYNYDYIQDLLLHLDGSLEVAVHTTGYPQPARFNKDKDGNHYGYPLWYDVSGTIHDHMLNWKVDLDIAGTSNSIRMDNIVQEERKDDDGFPQGGVSWFNKRVEQRFPDTEAEAALFWNGSTKADPEKKGKTSMFYIVNEDEKNRWGSARGYRLQHTLSTEQVLPDADTFGNMKGINWSKYKVAVTARREWEQNGATPLNQALPFAPVIDFDDLLLTSSNTTQPGMRNGTAPTTAPYQADRSNKGDSIRKQDLVLWISSGLQHLPGSEDAPVTPSSGPAIGFWLRPFNFFNESAAVSQPGSVVYIPMLSAEAAFAAQNASESGNASFTLEGTHGLSAPGNNTAPRRLFKDDGTVVLITDEETLKVARRGVQPYIGVAAGQMCTPNWDVLPAFNGSYTAEGSTPDLGNATVTADNANATQAAAANGSGVAVVKNASVAAGAAGPSGAAAAGGARTRGGPLVSGR